MLGRATGPAITGYLLAGLLAGVSAGHPARATSDRVASQETPAQTSTTVHPNIIFILADDLGYHDLGCYGQPRIRTPQIDRLAAEGVRFTDHYAGSTVCAPSRCVLMTGRHTGHCRIRGNARVPLEDGDVTLAEVLREAGYATALIGKWGLGERGSSGVPTRQGFESFFGYLNQRHAHNYYPSFLYEGEKQVAIPNPQRKVDATGAGVAKEKRVYSHDLFISAALERLEGFASAGKRTRPFYLYLALTIPHANNEAGKSGMEVPSLEPYAEEDWPAAQKAHAAMITRMDTGIGLLVEKLDELGLAGDTVIFFSSDNGPHHEGGADPKFFDSNGALRGIKRDLYEGGIRVPLIVRWPGKISGGRETALISGFQDILPTCAELAGTTTPADIDGISLVPELLGETGRQQQHEYLYWEFHEHGSKQAVRWGRWKAIRFIKGARLELYDLQTDPGESHDLAAEQPGIVHRCESYLDSARTPSKHWKLKE